MNFFNKTMIISAAAVTMVGATTLAASAEMSARGHHRYSAAQRQAYAAGYNRGFRNGHYAVAYGAVPVETGRSAAVGVFYPAPVVQPGVYGGPFTNGGLLGTGLLSGNGVLGTGVFSGQGALGLGVLGF